jgi:hypothetical protein
MAVLGIVVFDGTAGMILVAARVLLLLVIVVYATGARSTTARSVAFNARRARTDRWARAACEGG